MEKERGRVDREYGGKRVSERNVLDEVIKGELLWHEMRAGGRR